MVKKNLSTVTRPQLSWMKKRYHLCILINYQMLMTTVKIVLMSKTWSTIIKMT